MQIVQAKNNLYAFNGLCQLVSPPAQTSSLAEAHAHTSPQLVQRGCFMNK